MLMAVLAAANRTDSKVLPWLRMADNDDLSFEDLGFVPRRFVALGRNLVHAFLGNTVQGFLTEHDRHAGT